jgi:poly-gamma-glutamate synthesis protein (capsule biosynthesis protein)
MQLLCLGDVAPAHESLPEDVWRAPGGVVPSKDLKILFNWELAMGHTKNPTPRSRGPRLLAHPDSWRVIQRWSPGFAALATNHILDAGEEGLAHMIELLTRAGFRTVGAGRTREELTRPLFWETDEGRLAIVNWVFPETHPDWMAVPGPNCWPGVEQAKRTVHELRDRADWVLILVHWSDELFPYPRPEDRAIARHLAHMGADLVVGHHPHVVRGMELIGSCPVFYSLGNFFFSDIADGHGRWIVRQAPRNRESLGIQVVFRRRQRPKYRFLSFWQTKGQVILDPIRRAHWRMESASRPLRHFQDTEYAEWYAVQRSYFDKWGYRLHFGLHRLGLRGLVQKLLPMR